jgi:hypothetical protein
MQLVNGITESGKEIIREAITCILFDYIVNSLFLVVFNGNPGLETDVFFEPT